LTCSSGEQAAQHVLLCHAAFLYVATLGGREKEALNEAREVPDGGREEKSHKGFFHQEEP
jgi:hypothetical protein